MYKEYEKKLFTEGLENYSFVEEERLKLLKVCRNLLAIICWSEIVFLTKKSVLSI